MFETLIIAIAGIVGVMMLWVGVQAIWRKMFRNYIEDEDVLADRRSCGNCGCGTICQRKVTDSRKDHFVNT